ncbi:hypothetical protein RQP53_24670, partial [Paucibacter sp. APW11]
MNTAARLAAVAVIVIAASLYLATWVVESSWFWRLNAALPRQVESEIANAVQLVLRPIRPSEVQAQEEQLDFFLAW